jgi:hypothetical protein
MLDTLAGGYYDFVQVFTRQVRFFPTRCDSKRLP